MASDEDAQLLAESEACYSEHERLYADFRKRQDALNARIVALTRKRLELFEARKKELGVA